MVKHWFCKPANVGSSPIVSSIIAVTISWNFDCKPKEEGAIPSTASMGYCMQKITLKDYVPTDIKTPKIGWGDKCKAIIPVPGRIYCYAGPACICGWAGKKIEDFTKSELIELLNQNS